MDSIFSLFREVPVAFTVIALLIGLCVGSFLNVVIYRLPLMMERTWYAEVQDYLANLPSRSQPASPGEAPTPTAMGGSPGQDAGALVVADATVLAPATAAPVLALEAMPATEPLSVPEPASIELATAAGVPSATESAALTAPPFSAERFNLAYPPSACTVCSRPIQAFENVPILSYIWMRGRCACGQSSISIRYPIVELMTGIATALVAWRFGFGSIALTAFLLTWVLIAASWIDADTTLLPDILTLPLVWGGVLVALLGWGIVDLRSSVIGAMAGYLTLWSVFWGFKLFTGKDGMGYGDFKLLAAIGAWLGWQALFPVVLMASAVGAIAGLIFIWMARRGRDFQMPFGPYLAAGGFVTLLFREPLVGVLIGGSW
jgi:leader peptidase (prepilin peptidase) / N-methyltransferase